MPIDVDVTNQEIEVSTSGQTVEATVTSGIGPAGPAGDAATVTVGTVTTGAPGSSASVVNVGTSSAAVLNFTIPAGAAGSTGPAGPAGSTGPAGAAGTAATISIGTVTTGSPGSSAAVTNSGSSSAAVLNFTIPAGAAGEPGPAGENGAAGEQGPPGVVNATAPLTYDSGTQTVALSIGTGLAEVDGDLVLDDHSHDKIEGVSPEGVIAVGNAQPTPIYATASLRAPHSDTAFTVERWVDGSLVAGCVLGVRDADAILQSLSSSIVRIETSGGALATAQLDEVKFSDDSVQDTAWTGSVAWGDVTSTPTTLSGYGITDAVDTSDSRLADARTPTSHAHGDITNDGKIGTTADLLVVTGSAGAVTTASIGSGLTLSGGTLSASGGGGGSSTGSDLYLWSTFR